MTRVLSGAALIALAVGVVWFASRQRLPAVRRGAGRPRACASWSRWPRPAICTSRCSRSLIATFADRVGSIGAQSGYALDVALMAALVAIGLGALGSWRGGADALATVSAALFPALYLGLPIGALVAVRALRRTARCCSC